MPFAAALSEHPDAVEATAEVVGAVLDRVGLVPDVAVLFVSGAHADHVNDIAATVQAALGPGALIGTTAVSVVGGDREVEEQPAITLWAGTTGPARTLRLDAVRTPDGIAVMGLDDDVLAETGVLVLVSDPFSFPVDDLVAHLAERAPHVTVVGGMASAGFAPGANRLIADDTVYHDGAVALAMSSASVETVVSQGCRPIGDPMVVTRATGNVIHELAGRPALDRLDELFTALPAEERGLVERGLHIGRVVDEHQADFGRGDFLVRNVIGADRAQGTLAVGDVIEVGTTVQFHVRDAASADEDLRRLLVGRTGDAALVFTCNGRGMRLFGEPDHDAALVSLAVPGAVGGMFCAGEIGPVGGRSFVHGFTASIALFREPR